MNSQLNTLSLPKSTTLLPSIRLPFFGRASVSKTFRAPLRQVVSAHSPAAFLHRDISHRFGQRLRELRKERNMTQLQMAVEFGIDRSFISDVERGQKSISLHLLEVIALGMDLELSDLLEGL
jgi:DNA-binding XRE family transcriptional regulator